MSNYCVLFPGQGSQNSEMLDSYSSNNVFNDTIAEASAILGYDLSDIIKNEDKLNNTLYTQPIMVAVSIAIWRVWQQKVDKLPSFSAGHSLGEYTALVSSGIISFEDCLKLVKIRAKAMSEAMNSVDGGMAAVIGLSSDEISDVCNELSDDSQVIQPVNFNSENQIVVGGHMSVLQKSIEAFKKKGAKFVKILPVSIAAHTSLMNKCSDILYKELINIDLKDSIFPLVHNIDGTSKSSKDDIIDAVCKQVHSPVMWTDTINNIGKLDISVFIEIGPGNVLTGLNKRILKEIPTISISDLKNIDQALELL
ncbi:MAG: [acyl-carrier-protein] S-malonyltransferase [Gammaproteobacteria bacterium TMED257]|nr:MAG: [acyl-carrier-protein] S-malonyltransferase [Gammaproteobacteria bacterium TMED257]